MSHGLRWFSELFAAGLGDGNSIAKLVLCVTLVLLVVAAITRFWPRTSAAQRHLLWSAACGSILLAPLLQWVVPSYEVRVLPLVEQAPTSTSPSSTDTPTTLTPRAAVETPAGDVPAAVMREPVLSTPSTTTQARGRSWIHDVPWAHTVGVLWGIGVLFVLLALLRSHRQVSALVATASPLVDLRIRGLVTALAATTGRRSWIEIRTHPSAVPMVCGIFRPVIVLPEQALTWSETRLQHVLLHEMAHITRYDLLTQAVASLAVAVYWFHPMVWFAALALRREREHACDDVVLATEGPTIYADDLLDLATTFMQSRTVALTALPFARPSHVRDRLHAVLDTTRHRTRVSRRTAVVIWGMVLGILTLGVGLTLHPIDKAEAQGLEPRPWYESPVTVAPTVLTASADRPTVLNLVVENQTDSVTVSTPTVTFMKTDVDTAGNLVTSVGLPSARVDAPTATAWIQDLPMKVVLQPRQRRIVAFTVAPPPNLVPGVYYAIIDVPQANRKDVKRLKEVLADPALFAGDIQQAPTTLVVIRHGVPDTRVHLDSVALVGSRACLRLWTEGGLPYIGTLWFMLRTPTVQVTENSGRHSMLAWVQRPVALFGASSPRRFCVPLTALPDKISNKMSKTWGVPFVSPSKFSGPAVLVGKAVSSWHPWDNSRHQRVPGVVIQSESEHATVYVEARALAPR